MCISPRTLYDNSVYHHEYYSVRTRQVPCGECEECREAKRSEWYTRLCFEIDHTYKNGGCCVFLTFTYNDAHLPHYTDGSISFPCFNHNDVLTFTDLFETHCARAFGKGSFKKYFVSEYGKNTKRPHYHSLYFLKKGVDYIRFVELARSDWKFGFLFPKFDKYRNIYVDNDGRPDSPLLHNIGAGARYVSKYVTKDISFYEIPEVSDYLSKKTNKSLLKKYLPKAWMSKGIGYCALDGINVNSVDTVRQLLNEGITNPLTLEKFPCPRYILDKLRYHKVLSKRISPTTGKPLYDRFLTELGKASSRVVFDNKISRYMKKMSETFQLYFTDISLHREYQFENLSLFMKDAGISDISKPDCFRRLALYHEFVHHCSHYAQNMLLDRAGGSVIDSLSDDDVFRYWNLSRDPEYIKAKKMNCHEFLPPFFSVRWLYESFEYLDAFYGQISCAIRGARVHERIKDNEEKERLKRLHSHKYPLKLC